MRSAGRQVSAKRVDWPTYNVSVRALPLTLFTCRIDTWSRISRVWQEIRKRKRRVDCRRTEGSYCHKIHTHRIHTFIRFLTSARLLPIDFAILRVVRVKRTSSTRPNTRLSVRQLDESTLPTVFSTISSEYSNAYSRFSIFLVLPSRFDFKSLNISFAWYNCITFCLKLSDIVFIIFTKREIMSMS